MKNNVDLKISVYTENVNRPNCQSTEINFTTNSTNIREYMWGCPARGLKSPNLGQKMAKELSQRRKDAESLFVGLSFYGSGDK